MRPIYLCTVSFLLCTVPISLLSAERRVFSGAGMSSCGEWLEHRQMNSEGVNSSLTSWVQGLLSGLNFARAAAAADFSKALVILPDAPSMLAYVDKFCRENPLETPFAGSIRLFAELPPRKSER